MRTISTFVMAVVFVMAAFAATPASALTKPEAVPGNNGTVEIVARSVTEAFDRSTFRNPTVMIRVDDPARRFIPGDRFSADGRWFRMTAFGREKKPYISTYSNIFFLIRGEIYWGYDEEPIGFFPPKYPTSFDGFIAYEEFFPWEMLPYWRLHDGERCLGGLKMPLAAAGELYGTVCING